MAVHPRVQTVIKGYFLLSESIFSFNSVNKELSFSVSGDAETTGFVNVYIPKSPVNDINCLKVNLDGNQIEYSSQPQGDGWLLYFIYNHSTHLVTISLSSSSVNPSPAPTLSPNQTQKSGLDWVNIAILALMGTIVIIVVISAVRILQKKDINHTSNSIT